MFDLTLSDLLDLLRLVSLNSEGGKKLNLIGLLRDLRSDGYFCVVTVRRGETLNLSLSYMLILLRSH